MTIKLSKVHLLTVWLQNFARRPAEHITGQRALRMCFSCELQ